jgi:hypothetical protein
MRKPVRTAALLIAVFGLQATVSGCFGKFALTRKVYGFNDSIGNKFLKSVVLWAMLIIPVYELSAFVDWFLFNLIEFWSGSNPIALEEGKTLEKTTVAADGTTLKMVIADKGATARVEVTRPGEQPRVIVLSRTETSAAARDGAGALLGSIAFTNDGGAQLLGPDGSVRATRSKADVDELGWAFQRGPAAVLATLDAQRGEKLAFAH